MSRRPDAPPASVEEALARARDHARRSAAEAVAALRALLDAGTIAAGSAPEAGGALAGAARGLDELRALLEPDAGTGPAALFDAVGEALDAEIARWEQRSREDSDARAVLRAFLGLRELLWELGVRRPGAPGAPEAGGAPEAAGGARPRGRGRQVRHLRVEG